MSAESDDSIENIDFGGRFARQFFNNNCPRFEGDILNPITSTPVASDNSFSESGYESFNNANKLIDVNNNNSNNLHNSLNVIQRQQRSNSLFTNAPVVADILNAKNPWTSQALREVYQRFNNVDKIEKAASLHRSAATYSEPQYTWSGQLPSRSYKNPVYSCKVFLGGVPWDVTEQGLIDTFGRFGPLRVQWPGKDVRQQSGQTKAGYVYLIYESERCVKSLLSACTQDFGSGSHPEKYYYQISSRRMRFKEVQAIPWILADSNYIRNQAGRPDMHRTVFVGALHGMLTAEGLARVMNDLFGGVAYVGIDTDKYKYPLGSGRVTFNNQRSYMKALSAAFIEIKSSQFTKKIQLDPYLEPSPCSTCHIQSGPFFCRDCLRYYCKTCWNWRHSAQESIFGKSHRPLMRKKRET
jgi:cytoplasmic polyadenylation element-binding protein